MRDQIEAIQGDCPYMIWNFYLQMREKRVDAGNPEKGHTLI